MQNNIQYFFFLSAPVPLAVRIIFIILVALCLAFYFIFLDMSRKVAHVKEISGIRAGFETTVLKAQLEMQEQTFENLSRDIHDNIGQKLSLVKLHVSRARRNPGFDLADTEEMLSTIITDLRDLSRSLGSELVITEGLISALRHEMKLIAKTGDYKIEFKVTGESVFLDADRELVIYRICQEAIQNILKHAKANLVKISLDYSENFLVIMISDNGNGFSSPGTGNGLANMELRAQSMGGTCKINSSGKGTSIQIEIPIADKKMNLI